MKFPAIKPLVLCILKAENCASSVTRIPLSLCDHRLSCLVNRTAFITRAELVHQLLDLNQEDSISSSHISVTYQHFHSGHAISILIKICLVVVAHLLLFAFNSCCCFILRVHLGTKVIGGYSIQLHFRRHHT